MIRAAIDLGTNTCLLLLAEWDPSNRQIGKVIADYATVVRLGEGVDKNRAFAPVAMERTLTCLKGYVDKARAAGTEPAKATCVATSQARDAANGAEFLARIERETGFHFQIITGDQEAEFTFNGALLPGMAPSTTAVIDIGGGSTELMSTQGGQSLDIGSVRFSERHLKSDPVTDQEFWTAQEAIDRELERLKSWRKSLPASVQLLGVAGTVTTLAQWFLEMPKFNASEIDGAKMSRGDVHRQVEELKWRSVEERRKLPGVEEGRADILLAGALILWRTMEVLDFPDCEVSTRGLRFGAMRKL